LIERNSVREKREREKWRKDEREIEREREGQRDIMR
jgi:hypothetical protein